MYLLIEQASLTYVSWVAMFIYVRVIKAQCTVLSLDCSGAHALLLLKCDFQELILKKQ